MQIMMAVSISIDKEVMRRVLLNKYSPYRWQAKLRILEIEEIKTVPTVPVIWLKWA